MWKAYLELDNFQTLYFNAWENDFISDPLVGLLGELNKINSPQKTKDAAESMINTIGKIVIRAFPAMFKGVIKRHAGEEVVEVLCDCIEEGSSMLKKEIENYESQKGSLQEFRKELEIFVDEVCEKKPLIFIIDELDRCNPHYAVKVLERIKHLFNIPNIIFVLSIDKEQLSNSIRGYYGSESIKANEYLKRFIDIEYNLPDPDIESFCKYLFDYYDYNTYFKHINVHQTNNSGLEDLLRTATSIFKHKKLTLRQIEKIFTNIRLSLNMFSNKSNIYTDILCLLTYLRICESDCYQKIVHREYTVQDLIVQIEKIFPKQIFFLETRNDRNRFFYFTISLFLKCYTTTYFGQNYTLLDYKEGVPFINFKVNIINEELLIEALKWTDTKYDIRPLEYITGKIDLLENLQI